jgi:hypothetical protein
MTAKDRPRVSQRDQSTASAIRATMCARDGAMVYVLGQPMPHGSVGGPVRGDAFGPKLLRPKTGQAERAPVCDGDHGGLSAFTII